MNYLDNKHKVFFEEQILKTNSSDDPYRKAFFYLLGLTVETRQNISDLYDFNDNCIEFEGLDKPWQTGTTTRITRLAFNLYNGYFGEEFSGKYTPYNLFDCELMGYMFEAIKLLYPHYVSLDE
ncbi:hypothetical protein AN1V17_11510 [Vallitalea sediminicola]